MLIFWPEVFVSNLMIMAKRSYKFRNLGVEERDCLKDLSGNNRSYESDRTACPSGSSTSCAMVEKP